MSERSVKECIQVLGGPRGVAPAPSPQGGEWSSIYQVTGGIEIWARWLSDVRTYDPTTHVAISRKSLRTLDSLAWARYAYRPDEHPDADDALEESAEVLDAEARSLLEGDGDE